MATNIHFNHIPFQSWDLDLLVDYVLKFHHRNIRRKGEDLAVRLNALAGSHPELNRVADHFRNSVADLDMHCQKRRTSSSHTSSTSSTLQSMAKNTHHSLRFYSVSYQCDDV